MVHFSSSEANNKYPAVDLKVCLDRNLISRMLVGFSKHLLLAPQRILPLQFSFDLKYVLTPDWHRTEGQKVTLEDMSFHVKGSQSTTGTWETCARVSNAIAVPWFVCTPTFAGHVEGKRYHPYFL